VGGAVGANNGRILLDYLGGEGQQVFGGRLPSGINFDLNDELDLVGCTTAVRRWSQERVKPMFSAVTRSFRPAVRACNMCAPAK